MTASTARLRRWVALLASTSLALLVACVVLASRPRRDYDMRALLDDPGIREEVIAELISRSNGIFDSHPDPDVGRVLQPGLVDAPFSRVGVSSNRWGMRENEYELPKPDNVVRVVLLGDSFVFGWGVRAEDRMGVFLERWLRERSPAFEGEIEVLHLGVAGWNGVAEEAFVRRQLGELRPDLVVQLLIGNDLDDNTGVRGFGAQSTFDPRRPRRADARVLVTWPFFIGKGGTNQLTEGADWESRTRYEELAESIRRLNEALRPSGGRFLVVGSYVPHLGRYLEGRLSREQFLSLPPSYRTDRDAWVAPDNSHWNRAGHERFARLLFGVIRWRQLLPSLDLDAWPEAEREAREAWEGGADRPDSPGAKRPLLSGLRFPDPSREEADQVYTGIDGLGHVSPYASMVLGGSTRGILRLAGRRLGRHELARAGVRVLIDDEELGVIPLGGDGPFEESFVIPPSLHGRTNPNVRLVSDDWVYAGRHRRTCITFELRSVAVDRTGR